jgi:creatinine amidohydrolase
MLENSSWASARKVLQRKKIALIPVGSTEQHGPHLPLGTDFLTAQALAQSAAKKTGAVCKPVVPVGVSGHHRQFWGTLWVTPDTFRRYLYEIATSLNYHGVHRMIFVNGHGGNLASLQEISRGLRREGCYAVIYQWWTDKEVVNLQNKLFKSKGTHAGGIETAMMLAVRPELVDRSKFDEAARGAAAEWGISKFGAQLEVDTLDFSRSGATLDPREATKKAGKQIFKAAERRLVNLIRWLESAKESELKPKPHKE